MVDRYTSFEATAATYGDDTFTFATQHDTDAITEEMTPERNNIYATTTKGRTSRRKLIGPLGWNGTLETLFYTTEVPSLIYYGMGKNSTVVDMPAIGLQTHTVTQDDTVKHFIMAVGREINEHQFVNCVVKGFSIDFSPDAALSVSFDINARKELPLAAISAPTFKDFDAAERTFSGVEVVTSMGAAEGGSPTAISTVESANITYDNAFEEGAYVLGDQFLSGKFVNQIACSGSLELSYLASTDYSDVTSDTEKELEFQTSQGAGVAERGYTILLPRISYDTTNLPSTGHERYVQSLDWTANDNAAGDNIIFTFINDDLQAEFEA